MSEREREGLGKKAYCDRLEVVEGLEVPTLEIARAIHRAHPAVRVEPAAFRGLGVGSSYLACEEATAARIPHEASTMGMRVERPSTHASGL